MNYPLRPQVVVAILSLIAACSAVAYAGTSPQEMKEFQEQKIAAEAGIPHSQYRLGLCYERGIGVAKDPVQAVAWYRKSAEQGDVDGRAAMAQICFEGPESVRNPTEGVFWYRKSAEQGDSGSQFMLGLAYENGAGVSKDLVQSAKWLEKSAKQGHATAQQMLGCNYLLSEGASRNFIEGYAYLLLATMQDDAMARRLLRSVTNRMSADEVAAGQQRCRELQKEIDANIAAKKSGK